MIRPERAAPGLTLSAMEPRTTFEAVLPESPYSSRQEKAARVFDLIKKRDSDALRILLRANRNRPVVFNVMDAVRLEL